MSEKITVKKVSNYTVLDNGFIDNRNLSFKARGILATLLRLPPDWDYNAAGITMLATDGRDSVNAGLRELEANGYLERRKIQGKGGKFEGYEYIIYEVSRFDAPFTEKPFTGNPDTGKPFTGKPDTGNPQQISTNKPNTNKTNTNTNKTIEQEFEELWKLYPRKKGKDKALKAYVSARKKGTSFEEVEAGIKAYNAEIAHNGTKPNFIKYGSAWFNGRCWEDDYETTTGGASKPAKANGNPFMEMLEGRGGF